MMTIKQAVAYAKQMEANDGEPRAIFRTPANAPCNQKPANLFNKGPYAVCRQSEREDYEKGGAEFLTPPLEGKA